MARRVFAALALSVLVAACGSAPGAKDDSAAKKTATPAASVDAKPDISKLGDVTLTVWDQEVRGGQKKQIEQLNQEFMEKYPNVKIDRVGEVLRGPAQDGQAGGLRAQGARRRRGQPGPADHGRARQGAADPPDHGLREGLRLGGSLLPLLLDLNKFSSDGKDFGSGDLYGLSQMGEIVGVFYNKDKVTTPPTTLDEFEASLQQAKDAGDTPIMFGNLEKWPGIHNFESVLGQTADKQAIRDFVFAKEGASFDNPQFVDGATKIKDWVDKGYFNKNFNGTDYDPAWQQFAKGKSWYLIAGTWVTADLAEKMGDKVGFMLMPGKDAERAGLARRRVAAVHDHLGGQAARRGRGVHRLHHRRQRRQGADRYEQPARDEGRPGAGRRPLGRRRHRVAEAQ